MILGLQIFNPKRPERGVNEWVKGTKYSPVQEIVN